MVANPSPLQLQTDFVDLFANGPYLMANSWLSADVADTPTGWLGGEVTLGGLLRCAGVVGSQQGRQCGCCE